MWTVALLSTKFGCTFPMVHISSSGRHRQGRWRPVKWWKNTMLLLTILRFLELRVPTCVSFFFGFSLYTYIYTRWGFPSQRPVKRSYDVFFLTNGWANDRDAGDLRRHGTYYDVIVMCVFLATCQDWRLCMYRKISNIRRTEFQNLNASHLVLQLSLPNLLKPGVKQITQMYWCSADRRCSNYIWIINKYIAY